MEELLTWTIIFGCIFAGLVRTFIPYARKWYANPDPTKPIKFELRYALTFIGGVVISTVFGLLSFPTVVTQVTGENITAVFISSFGITYALEDIFNLAVKSETTPTTPTTPTT